MALSINQNIAAMNSYRNLSNTQNDQAKSLEKLSSGFRINRAADDAAGLAISEGLRSQVGGLKVAARNAQDGISVVQTAEGALTEVHSILQRVRDLAVQAGNDSNNEDARANIQTEATSLVSELDRIGKSTNFNGTKLLDGSAGTLSFQVGAGGAVDGAANRINVDLSGANVSQLAADLNSVSSGKLNVNTSEIVAGDTITFGDGTSTVDYTAVAGDAANLGALVTNLNKDANFSQAFKASLTSEGQLEVVAKAAGGTVTVASDGDGFGAVTTSTAALKFDTHANAQASVDLIDTKIASISTARAGLGALQNRFEHTIKNINVSVENLSASESRIRDTDMAAEMMNMTRSQILSQAGTAMLSQANQIPQGVLSLLR